MSKSMGFIGKYFHPRITAKMTRFRSENISNRTHISS